MTIWGTDEKGSDSMIVKCEDNRGVENASGIFTCSDITFYYHRIASFFWLWLAGENCPLVLGKRGVSDHCWSHTLLVSGYFNITFYYHRISSFFWLWLAGENCPLVLGKAWSCESLLLAFSLDFCLLQYYNILPSSPPSLPIFKVFFLVWPKTENENRPL